MKKLALLLAAMGVVSAAAFAGNLQVTSVSQKLENEHVNHQHSNEVNLSTTVNLKYDDWSFAIQGAKFWNVNTSRHNMEGAAQKKGLESTNGRLQLDAWNSLTPEFKLGYRYRGQKDLDRHYVRYSYNHDMYWTSGDIFYEFKNGEHNNSLHLEVYPLGVKYNGIKAGWFVEYVKNVHPDVEKQKSYLENQLRVWAPLYSDGAFGVSAEGRFTLASNKKMKDAKDGKKVAYTEYKHFGRNRIKLQADYKLTDNLSVYAYYAYEFRSLKYKNDAKKDNPKFMVGNKNYQDMGLGWTYTF